MIPVDFKGANAKYVKPDDGSEELMAGCPDLHVWRKGEITVSKWRLTMEERLALAKGGVVVLTIIGEQPPVMLTIGTLHE